LNSSEAIYEITEDKKYRNAVWYYCKMYATNIEIYDYVQAYERMQTSYDKKIIHNPTNILILRLMCIA